MKNGNLYQEVKSAKKENRVAWAKLYEMELAMRKELKEAIKPIKEKYEPILKALRKEASEKNGNVWNVAGIYHDCGRFCRYDIVNIVAVFLSYIEGERYIPFASSEVGQNSIIVKEKVLEQCDNMNYDILDKLYKNGDLVMLDNVYSNMVDFYNNVGDPNYSFGQFNYLREFVNRLIQYRIDNDKKNDIIMEDLYTFMCNFISTHPDLAQKNKDKRQQMLMGQIEEDTVISECKKLEIELKNNR